MSRIGLMVLFGVSGVSCASTPPVDLRPVGDGLAEPAPSRPTDAIVVAPPSNAHRVVVDAKSARTPIGHVNAGERVRISVISGAWNHDPSFPLVGAEGIKEVCSSVGQHQCIAGNQVAPMMGLVLLSTTQDAAAPVANTCPITDRLFSPTGLEMEAPDDIDLFLGPNDLDGELANNVGALSVEVEIAASKTAKSPITKEIVKVDARIARTDAGHVRRGQYLRITPKQGKWINDPKLALVDANGIQSERCVDGVGGRCLAGNRVAPLMGLMVLIGRCNAAPPPRQVTNLRREFIPWGKDFVATEAADLFLAPNDWEDGLFNNAGEVVVRVEIGGR